MHVAQGEALLQHRLLCHLWSVALRWQLHSCCTKSGQRQDPEGIHQWDRNNAHNNDSKRNNLEVVLHKHIIFNASSLSRQSFPEYNALTKMEGDNQMDNISFHICVLVASRQVKESTIHIFQEQSRPGITVNIWKQDLLQQKN